MIYDAKDLPSLSKFQFLAWTIVILVSFGTVAFIRILGGFLFVPVDIPANLVYLLGISISVVPVASYVPSRNYGESALTSEQPRKLKEIVAWQKEELENARSGKTLKPAAEEPKYNPQVLKKEPFGTIFFGRGYSKSCEISDVFLDNCSHCYFRSDICKSFKRICL